MWQPIETAPKDRFLLLCGPSGYTTTPRVFATGCMYSDYHVGRWVDHANDDLSDWGFEPTHWMPLPELPGADPTPSVPKLHVGNLPTVNQDDYPALGAWWVQLWDGDSVFARVYGESPEEAHNRASMLAAAQEAKP